MQDYKDTKLYDLIKQTGLKKSYIAEQLGMTPTTFWKKLSGQSTFTNAELYMLNVILSGEYKPVEKFLWE